VHIIEDEPGVARDASGPLVSPEVVVIANFPLKSDGYRCQRSSAGRLAQSSGGARLSQDGFGTVFSAGAE